jgi:hypothetical protein
MMDATDALSVSLPSADVHLVEHHIHDEDKSSFQQRDLPTSPPYHRQQTRCRAHCDPLTARRC